MLLMIHLLTPLVPKGVGREHVECRHLVLPDATSVATRRTESRSASDVTGDEYTMSD